MAVNATRRSACLIAVVPLAITTVQVWRGEAPPLTLIAGAVMAIVAFALVRLLSGRRPFSRGHLQFGRARPWRGWQAPVLWMAAAACTGLVALLHFAH